MAKKKKVNEEIDVVVSVAAPKAVKEKATTSKPKKAKAKSKVVEPTKSDFIQDNDIISNSIILNINEEVKSTQLNHVPMVEPVLDGSDIIESEEEGTLVDKFKKASENPFELRVKGMKIYDSHTSKLLKIFFAHDCIHVGNKRFPYNVVRIITK